MKAFSSYKPLSAVGFPSPAEDQVQRPLDLHDEIVVHPAATFFLRARGDDLNDYGIHDKDLLVVDRAKHPKKNDLIVTVLEDELTIIPYNRLAKQMGLQTWGVVTHIIHYASGS